MTQRNSPITLVDCNCETTVYDDGSGVELHFCSIHQAAPDLLEASILAETTLTLLWEDWKRENLPRRHWDAKPEHLPNNDISLPLLRLRAAIEKAKGQTE